jgi:hypothetical protein
MGLQKSKPNITANRAKLAKPNDYKVLQVFQLLQTFTFAEGAVVTENIISLTPLYL